MSSNKSLPIELLDYTLDLEERVETYVEELQQVLFSPPAINDISNKDQDRERQSSTTSQRSIIMTATSITSIPTIDPVLSNIFGTGTPMLLDADLASS